MNSKLQNPFNVTKAVDFSDKEILDFWVDMPEGSGFISLVQPLSPMPMIIEGGKGSGKTHLMRYLTLTNQLLRYHDDVRRTIEQDGYIGIYVRFSGLNASRFKGKKQSKEIWVDVFAYYSELWLGQLLLESINRLAKQSPKIAEDIASIGVDLTQLLTKAPTRKLCSLQDFLGYLQEEQRLVDHEINNCGITGSLNVTVNINRGALIFDGCRVISKSSELLRDIVFLFLLDEYENLETEQQKYVNTLIREKRSPANFKIGTRSYGIRTYDTLSGEEALSEGSEFSLLKLDEQLRANQDAYDGFCRRMICRRLNEALQDAHTENELFAPDQLNKALASNPVDYYLSEQTQFIISKYGGRERPYFARLRQQIGTYATEEPKGERREKLADKVIEHLKVPEVPLIEKVHVFLLYRAWAARKSLLQAACDIGLKYEAFTADTAEDVSYRRVLDKFKGDLFAQLLRECDRKQKYVGLKTLIQMSAGLPRNLLVLLKHVYAWAEFQGEQPFNARLISVEAQQRGVMDAADWFRVNARIPGKIGQLAHAGVARLAELFREIRFSDKPAECSLVTFSANLNSLDQGTQEVIDACEKWSLLIRVPQGHKDKNSQRVDAKYQLSPMLAPLWQLPVSRRGTIALNTEEVESIFAVQNPAQFDKILRTRLAPMKAPFERRMKNKEQEELGFESN